MKKIVFGIIATLTFSLSSFANNSVKTNEIKNFGNEISIIKTNKNDIPNCKDQGGLCAIIYTDANGNKRTLYVCCDNIVIVQV